MEDKEKQRLPEDDWVVYLPNEAMRWRYPFPFSIRRAGGYGTVGR